MSMLNVFSLINELILCLIPHTYLIDIKQMCVICGYLLEIIDRLLTL